jgi:hypothetical protein
MDIHNIGGLRRAGSWETADIGVIVYVFRRETLICRKLGLLQCKRLYPRNNDVDDNDPVGFFYGMPRHAEVAGRKRSLAGSMVNANSKGGVKNSATLVAYASSAQSSPWEQRA